jgi:hypothetical protein
MALPVIGLPNPQANISPGLLGAQIGQQLVGQGQRLAMQPQELQQQLQAQMLQNQVNRSKAQYAPQMAQYAAQQAQLAPQLTQANINLLKGKLKGIGQPQASDYQIVQGQAGIYRVNKKDPTDVQQLSGPGGVPLQPKAGLGQQIAQGVMGITGQGFDPTSGAQASGAGAQPAAQAVQPVTQSPQQVQPQQQAAQQVPLNIGDAITQSLLGAQQQSQQQAPSPQAQGSVGLPGGSRYGSGKTYRDLNTGLALTTSTTPTTSMLQKQILASKNALPMLSQAVQDIAPTLGLSGPGRKINEIRGEYDKTRGISNPQYTSYLGQVGENKDNTGSLASIADHLSGANFITSEGARDDMKSAMAVQKGDTAPIWINRVGTEMAKITMNDRQSQKALIGGGFVLDPKNLDQSDSAKMLDTLRSKFTDNMISGLPQNIQNQIYAQIRTKAPVAKAAAPQFHPAPQGTVLMSKGGEHQYMPIPVYGEAKKRGWSEVSQ